MGALTGVGTLTPGHQFYEQAQASDEALDPMFAPILDDLRELVRLARLFTTEVYCPVADFAHRFFFVRPPRAISIKPSLALRIAGLIKSLNGRLFTATEDHLASIQIIMMVAGSTTKALAMRSLLLNRKYRIRYLATDEGAARAMLDAR